MHIQNEMEEENNYTLDEVIYLLYRREAEECERMGKYLLNSHTTLELWERDLVHLLCDFYGASSHLLNVLDTFAPTKRYDELSGVNIFELTPDQFNRVSLCLASLMSCRTDLQDRGICLEIQ